MMISTIILVIVRNLEIYFLRKFLLLTNRVRGKIWSFSMSAHRQTDTLSDIVTSWAAHRSLKCPLKKKTIEGNESLMENYLWLKMNFKGCPLMEDKVWLKKNNNKYNSSFNLSLCFQTNNPVMKLKFDMEELIIVLIFLNMTEYTQCVW